MAHAMKRLGVYLGLVEDDPAFSQVAHSQSTGTAGQGRQPATMGVATATKERVAVVETPGRSRAGADSSAAQRVATPVAVEDRTSIHTIQPRSYNDARRIGEEYRSGSPVIMNLTEMADAEAKRIVDFAAGLVFAMRGSIEKVTNKVFLLSPADVDVRDNPAVQRARDGFFNQS